MTGEHFMSSLRSQAHIGIRILCVIALMLVGFSHKLASFGTLPQNTQASLTSYALPDGTLPILCLGGQAADPDNDRGMLDTCEFCRIATSVTLPDNPQLPEPVEFVSRALAHLPARVEWQATTYDTPAVPRAPPVII
tara:strand:+ start:2194 stop:2604 length:411 start_codon:yes stop_codon:yes gene_type:complete